MTEVNVSQYNDLYEMKRQISGVFQNLWLTKSCDPSWRYIEQIQPTTKPIPNPNLITRVTELATTTEWIYRAWRAGKIVG